MKIQLIKVTKEYFDTDHIVLKAIEVALKGHRSPLSDALVAKSKEGEE